MHRQRANAETEKDKISNFVDVLLKDGALKSAVSTYATFEEVFAEKKNKYFDSSDTKKVKAAYVEYEKEVEPTQKRIKAERLGTELQAWIGNRDKKNIEKKRDITTDGSLQVMTVLQEFVRSKVEALLNIEREEQDRAKRQAAHAASVAALRLEREKREDDEARQRATQSKSEAAALREVDKQLKTDQEKWGIGPDKIKLTSFAQLHLLFKPAGESLESQQKVHQTKEKEVESEASISKKGMQGRGGNG
jgi:hypothetical protein